VQLSNCTAPITYERMNRQLLVSIATLPLLHT